MAEAALEEKLEAERRLNEAVKKSLIPNVIAYQAPGSAVRYFAVATLFLTMTSPKASYSPDSLARQTHGKLH